MRPAEFYIQIESYRREAPALIRFVDFLSRRWEFGPGQVGRAGNAATPATARSSHFNGHRQNGRAAALNWHCQLHRLAVPGQIM